MDQQQHFQRNGRNGTDTGAVARVRVAMKSASSPPDPAPNDSLTMIWQAFCVVEGSPLGLQVIDQTTRCIRAPLLKRFCQFLVNNKIPLDHASSVERLLHREAPHMDWKPVVPRMLQMNVPMENQQQILRQGNSSSVPAVSAIPPPPPPPAYHPNTGPHSTVDRRDESHFTPNHHVRQLPQFSQFSENGKLSNPIEVDLIHDNTPMASNKRPSLPLSSKVPKSPTQTSRKVDSGPNGKTKPKAQNDHHDLTGTMMMQSSLLRKGGMRVDPSHMKLLLGDASLANKSVPMKEQAKSEAPQSNRKEQQATSSTRQDVGGRIVPIPSEADLRGEDLHAWPLLEKDLKFLFQPNLWPAFCKAEGFRLPTCYLPGLGFGLIEPDSCSIRIALVIRFFRFMKNSNHDQETMARCVRGLNKVILTESLARGLDWDVISLEKVQPILKIIGVSRIEDAFSKPFTQPASLNLQSLVSGEAANPYDFLANQISQNSSVPPVPSQLELLMLRQSLGPSIGGGITDDVLRQVLRGRGTQAVSTEPPRVEMKEADPIKRVEAPPSEPRYEFEQRPTSKNSTADAVEDPEPHGHIKTKCANIVSSVEDLIKSMEDIRSAAPSSEVEKPKANSQDQEQYQMVANSLNELTKTASRLLDQRTEAQDPESNQPSNPMESTLMMLKSSVESLSSKLDAMSQSLRSSDGTESVTAPSIPVEREAKVSKPWAGFGTSNGVEEEEEEIELNPEDIDSARKRAILSHARAERDRLKRQRR